MRMAAATPEKEATTITGALRQFVVDAWAGVRARVGRAADDVLVTPLIPAGESVTRIALGSCGKPELRGGDALWESVAMWRPELWLWLGDNVYADERYFDDAGGRASLVVRALRGIGDAVASVVPELYLKLLRRALGIRKTATRWVGEQRTSAMYTEQLLVPGYRKLLHQGVGVTGVYDDHDYGLNDAGKEFADKEITKRLALEFLDEPRSSPRWRRSGVFGSYLFGSEKGRRLRVILLDTRFNRDKLDSDGAMLGEDQWAWLERVFSGSYDEADITLIGSSIQFVGGIDMLMRPLMRSEGWVRFPSERKRLMRLLTKYRVPGVVFLSGDVHLGTITELAASDRCGTPYPIIDMTSSGLTHSALSLMPAFVIGLASLFSGIIVPGFLFPVNSVAAADVFVGLNWGSVEVDWDATPSPRITLAVRDSKGRPRVKKDVHLHSLQYPSDDASASAPSPSSGAQAECVVTDTFPHGWQRLWATGTKALLISMLVFDLTLLYFAMSLTWTQIFRDDWKSRRWLL